MIAGADIRDPAMMREELEDLLSYLNGLPDEVRRTGAFVAYEQRAGELSRELIFTDLLLTLPLPTGSQIDAAKTTQYGRVYEGLTMLTQRYAHIAEQSQVASRLVQWGVVIASAGSVLSALTAAGTLALPLSGLAALLAGISAGWLTRKARKQERASMSLSALREEMVHSFGPSGQVLRPSEYYSASTKRIESLLDEIKATAGSELATSKP
jgi:hypothetical protein